MSKYALVVVDLQNDFLEGGSLAVPESKSIVASILELIENPQYKWSLVVATKDWHPRDHTSFSSNHGLDAYTVKEFEHPLGEIDPVTHKVKVKEQMTWPDHCVQGTKGAELEEKFSIQFEHLQVPKVIVKKGYLQDREYYSCFQDAWGIHRTEMTSTLKKFGITDVVFVGLAFDYCVLSSAVDAVKEGFKSVVFTDCSKSVYPAVLEQTEKSYREAGVELQTSRNFLSKIQGNS